MSGFDGPEIYRSVLESVQTGVYIVDRDQKILFGNEGAEKITGYLRQDVIGAFCGDQIIATDPHTKNVLPDAAAALSSALVMANPTLTEVIQPPRSGAIFSFCDLHLNLSQLAATLKSY